MSTPLSADHMWYEKNTLVWSWDHEREQCVMPSRFMGQQEEHPDASHLRMENPSPSSETVVPPNNY